MNAHIPRTRCTFKGLGDVLVKLEYFHEHGGKLLNVRRFEGAQQGCVLPYRLGQVQILHAPHDDSLAGTGAGTRLRAKSTRQTASAGLGQASAAAPRGTTHIAEMGGFGCSD
eukprot:scaffold311_cov405-Prasinococcus_capsulatus_cf.AAC.4